MVVFRRYFSFICSLFFIVPIFSETEIHGSTGLSSGFMINNQTEQSSLFFSSSVSSARIESSTNSIKATLECSTSLSANSMTSANISHSFTVDKAYFKTRIPFINDSFMRLSIGKMPISWGYGMIYNAGDILFSQSPNSDLVSGSPNDISLLRSFSDWAFHLYLPLSGSIIAEAVFLPPLEPVFITEHITRSALQFQFLPYTGFLETAQLGASLQNNSREKSFNALKMYGGLDGTLFLDYNVCSSIEFAPLANEIFVFDKDSWSLSAALFYSLSKAGLRTELLYHPFSKSTDIFAMISFSILDSLSTQAVYNFSYKNISGTESSAAHTVSTGLQWLPVKGISLSLTWNAAIRKPDNITGVVLSGSYSF